MIEEDISGSENIKMEMVFQREEMENYIENLKSSNDDVRLVT